MENKKIEEILDAMTVEELSFFVKFKLKTYLPDTQNQIIQYLERNRGLTLFQLNQLLKTKITEFDGTYIMCQRCGSKKLFAYDVEWEIPVMLLGYEDEFVSLYERSTGDAYKKIKVECLVCGNLVINPNLEQMSFWQKLWLRIVG